MKVLVAGPFYYRYCRSVATGFQTCGAETAVLEWSTSGELSEPLSAFAKLCYHAYRAAAPKAYRSHHERALNARLIELHRSNHFDVVLLIKPLCVHSEALTALRLINPRVKIAVWMMDSIRTAAPVWGLLPHIDHLFLFEPADLEAVRSTGFHNASFLPVGYDPTHYRRLQIPETDLALFFCGAFPGYGTRLTIMQAVARYAADRAIRFEAPGAWWTKSRPDRWFRTLHTAGTLRRYIQNRRLTHDELNYKYNTARVCLNAHNEQSVHGLNPRTFEIAGAGGVVLTDYKTSLPDLFSLEADLLAYKSTGELIEKIDYLLSHEGVRLRLRESVHLTASNRHTFAHRARTILSVLNNPAQNLATASRP